MATGHYDAHGFWRYGEDDLADEGQGFSDVLNKLASSIPPGVHALTVAELGSDETIRAAAATAVGADIAGRDLVEGADSRLPQDIGNIPGWEHVNVTTDGYVLSGISADGPYEFFGSAAPARALDPITVPGWRHLSFDKTGTYVIDGIRSDGTHYFSRVATDYLDAPGAGAVSREAAVANYGDSMTGDHGGIGVSVGAEVGNVLGLPSFQGGVPGQTSTEAAFRGGGIDLIGEVDQGVIRSGGTMQVAVTVPSGPAAWKTGSAWRFDCVAVTEAGIRVTGALRKTAEDTWNFTPDASLTANVPAPRDVTFISDEGRTYPQRGVIFRAGRNNIDTSTPAALAASVARIVADYRAMRSHVYATQTRPRFLALPLYAPSNFDKTSATYAAYADCNAQLAP
ncbi:hypothetical protein ACF044_05010 [Microbacterium sp. NPDC016588]